MSTLSSDMRSVPDQKSKSAPNCRASIGGTVTCNQEHHVDSSSIFQFSSSTIVDFRHVPDVVYTSELNTPRLSTPADKPAFDLHTPEV